MSGKQDKEAGFALVTVMLLVALLMSLGLAYFALTHIEMSTTQASMDSVRGFYAAEGGLNVRADQIRQAFVGYRLPAGVSPVEDFNTLCQPGNTGSGDFACQTFDLERRSVVTYVIEQPGNPTETVVPRGEPYQNLSAQVYSYMVPSISWGPTGKPEAVLEMEFQSRLIPLFQFAAFYNKDLEILPGPRMTLSGPVHANGDLYLDADDRLEIAGQVTLQGELFHGRKDRDDCNGRVGVYDPTTLQWFPRCRGRRDKIEAVDLIPFKQMVLPEQDKVAVPEPDSLAPVPGKLYWTNAELRVVMDLDSGSPVMEIRNPDNTVDATRSADLNGCTDAVAHSETMYNAREGKNIKMLDVDLELLLDCVYDEDLLMGSRRLDDATHGGLVFHFTVEGPDSADAANDYGVRIRNGEELRSTDALAPGIRGLTIVSDQAIYVQGHYNRTNKKPAAIMADSLNVLSEDWVDVAAGIEPRAGSTEINAAFLAGTDNTGGGAGSQDNGIYNGGLENYPRLHENWGGETLRYRGSFVSLSTPFHVNGPWDDSSYHPPTRDWDYDTDFNDASKLPPLTPRVVYLKQELFVREFEF